MRIIEHDGGEGLNIVREVILSLRYVCALMKGRQHDIIKSGLSVALYISLNSSSNIVCIQLKTHIFVLIQEYRLLQV